MSYVVTALTPQEKMSMHGFLHAHDVKRFQVEVTDFTRVRVLSWPVVRGLRLRGQKVSLRNAVNKFFSALGQAWRVVTASADRQARQKVPPEGGVPLKAIACAEYAAR